MGGAIVYPEIIGTLGDACFLVVPAIKEEMAAYAERQAMEGEVGYRSDWNLVISKALEICLITFEVLWDDGNITIIGFRSNTWEQLSNLIHYRNLLLLPDKGLIENDSSLISPVAAREGFLIRGLDKGLMNLANKAANIPPELNIRGSMTYLSNLLNGSRNHSKTFLI